MQLPEWAARRPLSLALAAAALIGLLAGWFSTPLPQQTTQERHDTAWTPPLAKDIQRFDDKAFQALKLSASWAAQGSSGGVKSANGADSAIPAWSLVGIVLTPQPAALVINSSSLQVERVTAGAALPDGSVLKTIEHNVVSVTRAGCTRHIALFHTPQDTPDEACTPPDKAAVNPPATRDHP